jgi:hypothetical protein
VIALHSLIGVVETGLPVCPPEKSALNLACGVQSPLKKPVLALLLSLYQVLSLETLSMSVMAISQQQSTAPRSE